MQTGMLLLKVPFGKHTMLASPFRVADSRQWRFITLPDDTTWLTPSSVCTDPVPGVTVQFISSGSVGISHSFPTEIEMQSNIDISKLMGLLFTSSNYPGNLDLYKSPKRQSIWESNQNVFFIQIGASNSQKSRYPSSRYRVQCMSAKTIKRACIIGVSKVSKPNKNDAWVMWESFVPFVLLLYNSSYQPVNPTALNVPAWGFNFIFSLNYCFQLQQVNRMEYLR